MNTRRSRLPRRVAVIGGGIIGLAIARQLVRRGVTAHVIEKEARVGMHQSTRNSGVLHAGLYYQPGSLKAQLAVRGIRLMTAFCEEHEIKYEICGKLVVATEEEELPRLRELLRRGEANGLRGLKWLEGEPMREVEPGVAGIAAVQVPEEGIVDYRGVCDALVREIEAGGGTVTTGARVLSLSRKDGAGGGWRIETGAGAFEEPFLINAAGLHCDRVHQMAGGNPQARILPFRGEYFCLGPNAARLVRHLIYPVPNPSFPFLGVHFTRRIDGKIEAGPNAVLAFAREGYRLRDINLRDSLEALAFPGLWRFLKAYPKMCAQELLQSMSKERFCRCLQRLVPGVTTADLLPGGSGVRAQAIDFNGTLLQDFRFGYDTRALHILNAPSPGATASLAIAEAVVGELEKS